MSGFDDGPAEPDDGFAAGLDGQPPRYRTSDPFAVAEPSQHRPPMAAGLSDSTEDDFDPFAPPPAPATDPDSPATGSSGLGDLFTSDPAPATGTSGDAPTGSGLADLFAAGTTPAEPAPAATGFFASPAPGTASDLDDLFSDGTAIHETANAADAAPSVAPADPFADFFEDGALPDTPTPTPTPTPALAPAGAPTPTGDLDAVVLGNATIPAAPTRPAIRRPDVALTGPDNGPQLAGAPKLRQRGPRIRRPDEDAQIHDFAAADTTTLTFNSAADSVQHDAQMVLAMIGGEARLQGLVRDFRLTRDRAVDIEQRQRLEDEIGPNMHKLQLTSPAGSFGAILNTVYDELIGLGPLGQLWRDDEITEILVDDWDKVYIERNGKLINTNVKFRDLGHAQSLAKQFSRTVSDRELSPANPLVTSQLPGARVTFCFGKAVCASGISITLRKFRPLMGMTGLLKVGALTEDMAEFLQACIIARATTVVSGGTGVGKTTLLNALSEFIPGDERVVTIEDNFELTLANDHVVSLQTKERASGDDTVRVTQDMLLVNSLRMRPDRIIVGEVREAEGAYVMMQAANTGHDGTMTTIHANSVDMAMNGRLAMMVRQGGNMPDDIAKHEVTSAIDLVVQGVRQSGNRFVAEIAELYDGAVQDGNIVPNLIFRGRLVDDNIVFEQVGRLNPNGRLASKLVDAGIDPAAWA